MDTIIDKKIIKERIKNNITFTIYKNNKNIKNDICPILYSNFEENDNICIFNNCNHAIDRNTLEQFINNFDICPLCKCKLH